MFSRWWSIIIHLFFTAMKTQSLKYFGITTLTFWDYVMSSVTHVSIGLGVGTLLGLRETIDATALSHLSMTSFSLFSSSNLSFA